MTSHKKEARLLVSILVAVSCSALGVDGRKQGQNKDIRKLSQHFGDPKDISPWMFVPQDNIKSDSLTEHPGFVTIMHGEEGKDIKGILKDPIRIDDYPLPWEFHLGVAQLAPANSAIGVNLVLTFSDPTTWPQPSRRQPQLSKAKIE